MPDMPEMPPTSPATAQGSRSQSQYRSYSYDSAPAYSAPANRTYSRPSYSQQNQFRADHKIRGQY